ncbi:MAG: hypothetical protein HOK63_04100 [Thaumarchaeota archaeon]|jgi:hypothetical protein|nr:hypothetical protein [Nitrososphaerota archaeon]MBT5842217.1 hypothetical protein [Nitrososphaerota archaeon]MBT6468817.1 hypothetical protein [Nitrososphaerota archaeon]
MARKILPAISLGVITVFAILFLSGSGNDNNEILSKTFEIDAIYQNGNVVISFIDKSGNTDSITMEILGMDETFQKSYVGSQFTELVPFNDVPKYGWAIHPIVLEIEHSEFGHIQLKTEIHESDQPLPPVIYSRS